MRRFALLALLVLFPGGPALAQGPAEDDAKARWEKLSPEERKEKLRLYEQRWKNLPPEERARRLALFETQLRDMSPEQREELLRKLREVRRRRDLAELRGRQERLTGIERHLVGDLPPELRARISGLPRERRGQVIRHALHRLAEVTREKFLAWLSPEQRQKLLASQGPERLRRLAELEREQALVKLSPEVREMIRGLPEQDRRAKEEEVVRQSRSQRIAEARRAAEAEIVKILDLPVDESDVVLKLSRLGRTLTELGITDPEVRSRIARAPVARLKVLIEELKPLKAPEERRRLIDTFLASLDD